MNCLVLFGAAGCGVAQSVVYAACAGAWSGETDVLLVINDACRAQAERISQLFARYERLRAMMETVPGQRLGFDVQLHLRTWPDKLPETTLASWAPDGDDALLRQALFTREQAELDLNGDLSACPEAARAVFAALMRSCKVPVDGAARVVLAGSLSDGWGAAGVDAFARALGETVPLAQVLLMPYAGISEHTHQRAEDALTWLHMGKTAYVLGLNESDCAAADPAAANVVEWLAASCTDHFFRADAPPTGLMTWRAAAGKLGWETFPAAYRLCFGTLMKAAAAFRLTFQPAIKRGVESPKWLRDKLIGWYASYFRDVPHMEENQRRNLLTQLEDLAELLAGYTGWMGEIIRNLPPLLRSTGAMEQARAEAAANYRQYIETAGQLAVMLSEAEESGLIQEKTVHRHDMGDNESEKMQKLFQQMEAKKQALAVRQQELDRRIGGAAQLLMMKEAQDAWREESEKLHQQRVEAQRAIEEAAQLATLEEQHRIATARTKLQRMERYLDQVDACWLLVKSERRKAKEEGVRRRPPEIALDAALPESGLMDPLALDQLSAATPENKKLMAEAENAWAGLILPATGEEMTLPELVGRLRTREEIAAPLAAFWRDMTLLVAKEVRG